MVVVDGHLTALPLEVEVTCYLAKNLLLPTYYPASPSLEKAEKAW